MTLQHCYFIATTEPFRIGKHVEYGVFIKDLERSSQVGLYRLPENTYVNYIGCVIYEDT